MDEMAKLAAERGAKISEAAEKAHDAIVKNQTAFNTWARHVEDDNNAIVRALDSQIAKLKLIADSVKEVMEAKKTAALEELKLREGRDITHDQAEIERARIEAGSRSENQAVGNKSSADEIAAISKAISEVNAELEKAVETVNQNESSVNNSQRMTRMEFLPNEIKKLEEIRDGYKQKWQEADEAQRKREAKAQTVINIHRNLGNEQAAREDEEGAREGRKDVKQLWDIYAGTAKNINAYKNELAKLTKDQSQASDDFDRSKAREEALRAQIRTLETQLQSAQQKQAIEAQTQAQVNPIQKQTDAMRVLLGLREGKGGDNDYGQIIVKATEAFQKRNWSHDDMEVVNLFYVLMAKFSMNAKAWRAALEKSASNQDYEVKLIQDMLERLNAQEQKIKSLNR
jgi:hypothetical protein